jgi:hypothetical protein
MRPATLLLALILAACGGDYHDTADPWAASCDEVECPGGSRVEWQEGDRLLITCAWDCLLMDGDPTELRRTWEREAGECYAISAEWRRPVLRGCDG